MKKVILLLMGVLLLQSCKKDEPYVYEGIYRVSHAGRTPVRLITRQGEITDASLIADYLQRNNKGLFSPANANVEVGDFFVWEFLSKNEVKLFVEDTFTIRTLYYKGKTLTMESQSLSSVYVRHPELEYPLFKPFDRHKPLYMQEELLPASSGFHSRIDYKECIFLNMQGEQLVYPAMAYIYHGPSFYLSGSGSNNEYREDFAGEMSMQDTLAFQYTKVVMKRQ